MADEVVGGLLAVVGSLGLVDGIQVWPDGGVENVGVDDDGGGPGDVQGAELADLVAGG